MPNNLRNCSSYFHQEVYLGVLKFTRSGVFPLRSCRGARPGLIARSFAYRYGQSLQLGREHHPRPCILGDHEDFLTPFAAEC
jgi:hypothetical protein